MLKTALFYYCLILSIFIALGAASNTQATSILPFLLFLPVSLFFLILFIRKFQFPYRKTVVSILLYYSFIIVTLMSLTGFLSTKTISQLISSVVFLPMVFYFMLRIWPKKPAALNIPMLILHPQDQIQPGKSKHGSLTAVKPQLQKRPAIDINRRQFLRLVGSAGLTLFMFSIFAKKAEAAFFGSVPGPGTVAIKDTSGAPIDPAIKTPTDGYKICQLDDSSPAYYGFVNKDGDWFIMKEDPTTGDYRYYKKKDSDSTFSTGWTDRASLNPYGYFDAIF